MVNTFHLNPRAKMPFVGTLIYLAIASTVICYSRPANAAEIANTAGTIILEGQIELGDYNKLRYDLLRSGDYSRAAEGWCSETYEETCPHEIYLASPGGNAAEAMKIGRLVRALGWTAIVPVAGESGRQKLAKESNFGWFELKHPEKNYVCASVCFLIFAGAMYKDTNLIFGDPLLGLHKPFLSKNELKGLTSSEMISTINVDRETVEKYLREMEVPIKYIGEMFDPPKSTVQWIGGDVFDKDFRGFAPSLRDWVEAKCNNLTDIEKAAWEAIKNKRGQEQSQEERRLVDLLSNKIQLQQKCESDIQVDLPKDAWVRWRGETSLIIANACSKNSKNQLVEHLASTLSVAKANDQSSSVVLDLVQNLTLCFETSGPRAGTGENARTMNDVTREGAYALREYAIRVLAGQGDSKAERILGNLLLFGGSTVSVDQVEAVKFYGLAGKRGDLSAQEFYDVLSRKLSAEGRFVHDEEFNFALGSWIAHNCPALC